MPGLSQNNTYSYWLDPSGVLRDSYNLAVTKADPNVPMGAAPGGLIAGGALLPQATGPVDPSVTAYIDQFKQATANTQPGVAGTPQLFTGSGGGENQDLSNINYILNPNFDTTETQAAAAEQSLGQGTAGSGFASGTRGRLLESERLARFQLGHQLLEPYLQRQFQAGEGAADRAARLNEIASQGAQALQQLQLEQAGAMARSSAEQNAALQRQVLAGQQAMSELTLRETGESSRLNTSIGGNLANTRLGILGDIARQQIQHTPPVTPGQNYTTGFDWVTQSHTVTPRPSTPTGVAGGNTIDDILRRYHLL